MLNVRTIGLRNMVPLQCSSVALRVLITIPAGINRMNVVVFTILSLIGTTVWNFALIYLGKLLSGSWDVLMNGLHTYSYIMYVVIILEVIFVFYRLFKKDSVQ